MIAFFLGPFICSSVCVSAPRKKQKRIPLFKKGSRNKSINYRPVSLTSVICKLLETILMKHKLINPSQHGFIKAKSCLTNVLCFFGRNKVMSG